MNFSTVKLIELLVHTDLTVTTDRLMDLFQSVEDPDRAGSTWWEKPSIGGKLGLPQSAIDEIRSSYQSAARRKEAYLDTYANQHPWPSWRNVVDVLRLCDLHQQSDDVKNTYVQGNVHFLYIHLNTFKKTLFDLGFLYICSQSFTHVH